LPWLPLDSYATGSFSVEPALPSKVSQQSSTNNSDSSTQCSAKSTKLEASFHCLASKLKEVYQSKSLTESKNVTELVQIAVDKARMSATTLFTELGPGKGFRCDLSLDFVLVSTGEAQNKRLAKQSAYIAAADVLRMPYLRVVEDSKPGISNFRLVTSQEPFFEGKQLPQQRGANSVSPATNVPPKELASNRQMDKRHYSTDRSHVPSGSKRSANALHGTLLNDFVILQPNITETNAVSILQQSADFNKWPLEYSVTDVNNRCRCSVTLGGHVLSDVTGESKSTAKIAAAEQALKWLSSICCTVCVKKLGDEELDDTLKRSEVVLCCMSFRTVSVNSTLHLFYI